MMDTTVVPKTDAKIYPNPYNINSATPVRFEFSGAGGGEVRIYTISGKLVKKITTEAGITYINWYCQNEGNNKITRGIYLYTLTDGNGKKVRGKLAIVN
jgi:hypothetical protein